MWARHHLPLDIKVPVGELLDGTLRTALYIMLTEKPYGDTLA